MKYLVGFSNSSNFFCYSSLQAFPSNLMSYHCWHNSSHTTYVSAVQIQPNEMPIENSRCQLLLFICSRRIWLCGFCLLLWILCATMDFVCCYGLCLLIFVDLVCCYGFVCYISLVWCNTAFNLIQNKQVVFITVYWILIGFPCLIVRHVVDHVTSQLPHSGAIIRSSCKYTLNRIYKTNSIQILKRI